MQNIITFYNGGIAVGEEWKCVTHFFRVTLADIARINANRDDLHSTRFEVRQMFLETPQLGVTKWSPVAAVKNYHRAIGRKQIGKRDLLSAFIRQRKLRGLLPHPRRLCGKWNLL